MAGRVMLQMVACQLATRFVVDAAGRMIRENDPDGTAAPRLHLAGCREGNRLLLRQDVNPDVGRALEALASEEPPLDHPDAEPVHLAEYLSLLAAESTVRSWHAGLSWHFPRELAYRPAVSLALSGSPEGERLLARFAHDDIPQPWRELGFVTLGDFWPPWCAALAGDEIVSLAFTARRSPTAAEVGVVTLPAWRGLGYGAAATAGWARHTSFRSAARAMILYYSTQRANGASQRVARRLGLRFLGATFSVE